MKRMHGFVAVSTVLLLWESSNAAAQSVRMATSWAGPHFDVMAKGFASNVDLLTSGKVKVEVFPAGTIGSALKVTETVQKKVAQAGHHWSGYDYGLDKTSVLFGGYAGSMPSGALHPLAL